MEREQERKGVRREQGGKKTDEKEEEKEQPGSDYIITVKDLKPGLQKKKKLQRHTTVPTSVSQKDQSPDRHHVGHNRRRRTHTTLHTNCGDFSLGQHRQPRLHHLFLHLHHHHQGENQF